MSAKWTFMVYVAGYNNLSTFAGKDLAEMRKLVEPVIGRWSQKSPFIAEFVKEARKIVT